MNCKLARGGFRKFLCETDTLINRIKVFLEINYVVGVLQIACKMGVSKAKEVEFTTGLPLLQGKNNLIEFKLIDGIPVNIYAGVSFLL